MKRMTLTLPALLLGTSAFAAATVGSLDANNDDFVSMEEIQAVYTELKAEEFEQIDANGDNRLGETELLTDEAQEILSQYEVNPLPYQFIDLNGDGFSEYEEITTVFTELSAEDFNAMDTNNDSRLSQVEIDDIDAQVILNQFRGSEEVATIGAADVDGDNFLSEAEAMTAYPGLTEVEFDQIDLNDDNRVDYAELYESEAQEIVAKYES